MTTINFKEFRVFADIAHKTVQTVDVRETLGNHLYTQTNGIAAHDLAFRIYRSEGEIELSQPDVDLLNQIAQGMTPMFIDSLAENLKNTEHA